MLVAGKQAAQRGGLSGLYQPEAVRYIKLLNFVKDNHDVSDPTKLQKALTCNSWVDVERVRASQVHSVFKPLFNYRQNVGLTVSDNAVLNSEQMRSVVRLASLTDTATYKRAYANIYGRLFQNEVAVQRAFDFAQAGVRVVIRGLKIGR